MQTIPLNKLTPSDVNVRRRTDPDADAQLKADIDAHGLLQNLVVKPAKRGKYEVLAGGRRLKALEALAAQKKLKKTEPIGCLVIEAEGSAAEEASLAENLQRLAMNPADECTAFKAIIGAGGDAEGVAQRFGLTVRHVEGRLRLAELAEPVFDALAAGEITLDIAKAYGSTADQDRQAAVFETLKESPYRISADSVRRMIHETAVSGSDSRARFVGADAYLAAGGRIERDLFSEDDAEQWLDPALLETLAQVKLAEACGSAAKDHGLAWIKPNLSPYHVAADELEGLRRVTLTQPDLTDEQMSKLQSLDEEWDRCIAVIECGDEPDDARRQAEARLDEIESERAVIENRAPVVPDDLTGKVGAFLTIGQDGTPRLMNGYYAEDVPTDEAGAAPASNEPEVTGDPEPAAKPALSQTLQGELAMQRRDVLRAVLTGNAGLAFDYMLFAMAEAAEPGWRGASGTTVHADLATGPVSGFEAADTEAARVLSEADAALDRSWSEPRSKTERFTAFRALPDEARAAWLACLVARTLEADVHGEAAAMHDALAATLDLDVAAWWRPTGANYFDRVKKDLALDALRDVGGGEFASRYARGKKAELSAACQKIFAGDFIAEPEVKAAALAWLPEPMRFRAEQPDVAEGDDLPPWEDTPAEDGASANDAAPESANEAA